MVWACFHGNTKGPLVVFEKGSIDSLVYQNTLREGLLGLIEEEEGVLGTQLRPSSLIFMQDNAPIHKSNSTLEFPRSFNISPMAWTPNSPDLNPIEIYGMGSFPFEVVGSKGHRLPLRFRR